LDDILLRKVHKNNNKDRVVTEPVERSKASRSGKKEGSKKEDRKRKLADG
jgi:hypothetical protein